MIDPRAPQRQRQGHQRVAQRVGGDLVAQQPAQVMLRAARLGQRARQQPPEADRIEAVGVLFPAEAVACAPAADRRPQPCLLYTSDAADDIL